MKRLCFGSWYTLNAFGTTSFVTFVPVGLLFTAESPPFPPLIALIVAILTTTWLTLGSGCFLNSDGLILVRLMRVRIRALASASGAAVVYSRAEDLVWPFTGTSRVTIYSGDGEMMQLQPELGFRIFAVSEEWQRGRLKRQLKGTNIAVR